jgi:hypothetical protein
MAIKSTTMNVAPGKAIGAVIQAAVAIMGWLTATHLRTGVVSTISLALGAPVAIRVTCCGFNPKPSSMVTRTESPMAKATLFDAIMVIDDKHADSRQRWTPQLRVLPEHTELLDPFIGTRGATGPDVGVAGIGTAGVAAKEGAATIAVKMLVDAFGAEHKRLRAGPNICVDWGLFSAKCLPFLHSKKRTKKNCTWLDRCSR